MKKQYINKIEKMLNNKGSQLEIILLILKQLIQ